MILRRVIKHVRNQEWTAIFIDFIIVVVGVFAGFQVSEWAVEQSQRASETSYLERLHNEVVQLTQDRVRYNDYVQIRQLDLMGAVAVLQNQTDRQSLTDGECEAIIKSHIYSNPTATLPTISELLSTGRFDALRANEVRLAITQFNQSALRAGDLIEAVNRNILALGREFPQLIKLKTTPDENTEAGTNMVAQCDTDAMKTNQRFLNSFTDNRDRYGNYAVYAIKPVSEKLNMLHVALDIELGIAHDALDEVQ